MNCRVSLLKNVELLFLKQNDFAIMRKISAFNFAPLLSKVLSLFILLFFFSAAAYAQTVTGVITNANNEPVSGVTVQVKNSNKATITNDEGRFEINATGKDVLTISSVGYSQLEVPVQNRNSLSINIEGVTKSLDEVVVTALGIGKQSRSLGYATSTIKADELTVNRTPNLMNTLQGKVAGVNISGLGTGPAGTSKIRIRGQSSISGQNLHLIVINGIPVDNTNFGTNPGSASGDASIGVRGGGNTSDGGDGLSSINPDDIESMTILKGAAAAALYGSRAKDGVIMITTKTRGKGKGIGVTL